MSNWHDDPDLVRQADEDDLQRIEVEARWSRLFDMVEIIFAPGGGGILGKVERGVFRGFLWQAKKKVAVDPAGARAYVIESIQNVTAALEVEPSELYPDRDRLLASLKAVAKEAAVG